MKPVLQTLNPSEKQHSTTPPPPKKQSQGAPDVLAGAEATAELGAGELHHLVALATYGLGFRV